MPTFWPFLPNAISERLMFKTDVRSTRTGEFRDSLKDATQVFQFTFVADPETAARAEQLARENIAGEWLVPIWTDLSRMTVTISATDTEIEVEAGADYRAGGQAVILQSDRVFEIVDVVSLSGTTLTVSEVVGDYTVGALVAPLGTFIIPGGLRQSLNMTRTNQTIELYRIDPLDLSSADLSVFATYDVQSDRPAVLSPLEGGLRQQLDFIDNGFGSFALETKEDYIRWRGMVGFIDLDFADRFARRRWMHRARGRDRPFWLPTWKTDLIVAETESSGSSVLRVRAITAAPAGLVGRSIQIDTGDAILYRTITAAVTAGSNTNLTLNTSHGVAVGLDAVVSWLRLVRFDTDVFEMQHEFRPESFATRLTAPVVEVLS